MKIEIPIPYVGELDDAQQRLLDAVIAAHQKAARSNKNVSSITMLNASMGSGRLENGIAAAIMTMGNQHAPLIGARGLYENGQKEIVLAMLSKKMKIPGFGNSFYKTSLDPAWEEVWSIIQTSFPRIENRIAEISSWLIEGGKPLYPNAAMLTAATLSEIGWRGGTEQSLFILSRLPVWVDALTEDWEAPKPQDRNRIIA